MATIRPFFVVLILSCILSACHSCWFPADAVIPDPASSKEGASFECSPEKSHKQQEAFLEMLKIRPHASACAEHWWLQKVAKLADLRRLSNRQNAFIIDIGCNKGYFTATALNHMAPEYGNHLVQMYNLHVAKGIYSHPCGGCGECRQVFSNSESSNQLLDRGTIDVMCYEPSEVHVDSLIRARDVLYGKPSSYPSFSSMATAASGQQTRINFNVHHKAVSNKTGSALFPSNCTVNTCILGRSSAGANGNVPGKVEVNLTTVDNEMHALGWPYVDVLKIDTEGNDPVVLAGAYDSLRKQRLGAVSFEYHSVWKGVSGGTLKQCVSYMEVLGYACYYDSPKSVRISGSCWLDAYELRTWSNIICAVTGSALEAALQANSYLASEECGSGKCGV